MRIKLVNNNPEGVFHFHDIPSAQAEPRTLDIRPKDADHIAEIFKTELNGSYNWDYEATNKKLVKLYELGKSLNWNAETDIDWSVPKFDHKKDIPIDDNMFLSALYGYAPFEKLNEEDRMRLRWHSLSLALSNFVHGEQGALLVASQLVTCAPTEEAKLYAASQTFDEGRHVEVYVKYLHDRIGYMYGVDKNLKALLDKVLTDPRWDLKFIGMQIVIESLALAAFEMMAELSFDPVLKQVTGYVMRDEGRHVGFGVIFLEELYKSGVFTQQEIEERAMFTYEAALLMRERLVLGQSGTFLFGWPEEEIKAHIMNTALMNMFRDLLFSKLLPNVKKIGLLTDKVRPLYEKLGIMEYENQPDASQIDWVAISKPFSRSQEAVSGVVA